MNLHQSSRRLRGARDAPRPNRRPTLGRSRPRLEALEDRSVPSAGSLDPTFGTAGKATAVFAFFDDSTSVTAAALDQQGRILVAGTCNTGLGNMFAAVRFNPDGSLDPSFSFDGRTLIPVGFFGSMANAVAVDSQGRIILAGNGSGPPPQAIQRGFAVVRLLPNGEPDPSFGSGGIVVTPIGSEAPIANAVAIDAQDRIVVAGVTFGSAGQDFAVARYTTSGALDPSFDAGAGIRTIDVAPGTDDAATAVAVDGQGRIVVGGYAFNGSNNDFALARLNPDGSLDTTFGLSGITTTDFANGDVARGLALDGQGRVVLAGSSGFGDVQSFAVARYTSAGVLDPSFAGGGLTKVDLGSGHALASSVAIDLSGNVVVAGSSRGSSGKDDFAVARFNGAGALDSHFGNGGFVTTSFGSIPGDQPANALGKAVLVDAQGRLVVAGYAPGAGSGSGFSGIGVARYESAGAPTLAAGLGGGGTAGQVATFDAETQAPMQSMQPFGPDYHGEVRVAMGDVNGDGVPDMIVGAGPGTPGGHVKVLDGVTGAELYSFFAFPGFTGGVFVAAGDVDHDGKADVIVGAGPGAGPHVKVFSGRDGSEIASFFAFAQGFAGGVSVAAADLNSDGFADVVVGAGPGGPPHVKVFSGRDLTELASFFAFDPAFAGGVSVAAGDFDGDGRPDLLVGAGPGAGPHVRVFSGRDLTELASFFAFDPAFAGGVRLASTDWNGDGKDDVVAAAGTGSAHLEVFEAGSLAELLSFLAVDSATAGAFVAASS
jgi:uncharacterized delta-60 repeat protein